MPHWRSAAAARWRASALVAVFVALAELDVGTFSVDANGLPSLRPRLLIAAVLALPIVFVAARSTAAARVLVRPPLRWAVAWLAWGALTTLWSALPVESISTSVAQLGLLCVGAWFVARYGFVRFADAFVVGASAFLLVGLPSDLHHWATQGYERFSGYSVLWTDLSRLAMVSALLALVSLRHHRWRSTWRWAAFGLAFVELVGTSTRTTTVAFVVALAMMAGTRIGAGRTVALLAAATVVVAVPLLTIDDPAEIVQRQDNQRDLQDVNGRRDVWSASADLIAERPFVGHGVGTAPLLLAQARAAGRIHFDARHAHDIGMQLLLTDGVVGVVLFGGALVSYARRRPRDTWAASIVVAVLVSGLTEGVVDRPTAIVLLLGGLLAERSLGGSWEPGETSVG